MGICEAGDTCGAVSLLWAVTAVVGRRRAASRWVAGCMVQVRVLGTTTLTTGQH